MNANRVTLFLTGLLIAGGCATAPPSIVTDVQAEYSRAKLDKAVVEHASVELYEAEKAVQRLEQAAERDHDEELDHLAYLARRRVEIARETAAAGVAIERVEQLGEDRHATRLRARTAAVTRAETEAATAIERAKQLEQALSDLKAEQTERGVVLTMADVLFAFDRSDLQPGASQSLGEVARYLKEFPDNRIEIEGHTDSVGGDDYNQKLSERRARAVANFLMARGIDRNRVAVAGLGEAVPVASNGNEAGRKENRRVEIILPNQR